MKTCPECNGEKEFKTKSTNPLDVYSDGPPVYKTTECQLCNGDGRVLAIDWAIWMARGGMPMQNLINH